MRRHWFVFVRPAAQAWVGMVLMAYGGFGIQLDLVVIFIGLGLVLMDSSVVFVARAARGLRGHQPAGVPPSRGVFYHPARRCRSPGSSTSPWTKPLHGRLLGFGHLTFESAAQEQGLRDIRYVARPDQREHTIQRTVQR